MMIPRLPNFRRCLPKASPPILGFRRSGDGRWSEIQNGPEGDGLVEEVERLLVGIGDDSGGKVDPFGDQLASHEPEVVVEVVVLAQAERMGADHVVACPLASFGIAGDESIDGEGRSIFQTRRAGQGRVTGMVWRLEHFRNAGAGHFSASSH